MGLMCGQDVTMIEPRLVIWNHLEAIPTKVFFYYLFFFSVLSYVKKSAGPAAGEFDSFLSGDMTGIGVEEPDLFFLDFSFLYI